MMTQKNYHGWQKKRRNGGSVAGGLEMKPFSGTTFDVYMFVKIRRSSWMKNKRGESHGVKRRTQASHGKGPDDFWLKTAIFLVSVFLLLFSMKFGTELENYQYDTFK